MKRGMTGFELLKTLFSFPAQAGTQRSPSALTSGSGPRLLPGMRGVFILPLPLFPHTRLTPPERAAGALGSGGVVVSRAGAV